MKPESFAAILGLIYVIFPAACQKSGQWKGQITEVNGVIIVEEDADGNPFLVRYAMRWTN